MPEPEEIVDPPEVPVIDPSEHANALLENALLRAGVDLDTPRGQLVRDAWAGKSPDLEAIKAHWELVKPPPEPAKPLAAVEARIEGEPGQAEERRELAASSVVEPNPEDTDPNQAAVQAGIDALTAGGTRDDAIASGVHTLVEAAGRNDPRVLAHDRAS